MENKENRLILLHISKSKELSGCHGYLQRDGCFTLCKMILSLLVSYWLVSHMTCQLGFFLTSIIWVIELYTNMPLNENMFGLIYWPFDHTKPTPVNLLSLVLLDDLPQSFAEHFRCLVVTCTSRTSALLTCSLTSSSQAMFLDWLTLQQKVLVLLEVSVPQVSVNWSCHFCKTVKYMFTCVDLFCVFVFCLILAPLL